MRLSEAPDALKRLQRTSWEFQRTFETPLCDLARFVAAILSALSEIQAATVIIEGAVAEPHRALIPLYERYALPAKWSGGTSIEAQNADEASELLQTVLSEWIDFVFIPSPKPFVIYADHDEYTTFFAHRKSNLNRVTQALNAARFQAVDYVRKF
jgi:hypothetical protein